MVNDVRTLRTVITADTADAQIEEAENVAADHRPVRAGDMVEASVLPTARRQVDAVRAAQIETAAYFNFTPYVVAGLLFVLLAIPTIRLTDWYTARVRAREQIGGIV